MNQFEEVFDALDSLKEELRRLRRIEQDYLKLKHTYETLLNRQAQETDKGPTESAHGFYFYVDAETYTGYSAHTIDEFVEAVNNVPLQSLEFHIQRQDFENWLSFIGHPKLAQQVQSVREARKTGDKLKQSLLDLLDHNSD